MSDMLVLVMSELSDEDGCSAYVISSSAEVCESSLCAVVLTASGLVEPNVLEYGS